MVKAARQKQVTRACLLLYEFLARREICTACGGGRSEGKELLEIGFKSLPRGEESLEDAPERHFP